MTASRPGSRLDERFLAHRLKSTSLAGVVGGVLAAALLGWRFYVDGIWSWDLLAVGATMAGVKLAAMTWFHFRG
ncbi:MAG: hypothetical protein MUE90_14670 [Thermoanaerobaculales bacterium]|jgi:hypothetical protein|nr:hypothetical protein [Thermoanaerobaculales bacterium]